LGLKATEDLDDRTNQSARLSRSGILKVDAAVQPDLHPVARHLDANHDWNVWNIRKNALNLVNFQFSFVFTNANAAVFHLLASIKSPTRPLVPPKPTAVATEKNAAPKPSCP
jgi:hypothetical protein